MGTAIVSVVMGNVKFPVDPNPAGATIIVYECLNAAGVVIGTTERADGPAFQGQIGGLPDGTVKVRAWRKSAVGGVVGTPAESAPAVVDNPGFTVAVPVAVNVSISYP